MSDAIVSKKKAIKATNRIKSDVKDGQNVGFSNIDDAPETGPSNAKSAFDKAPVKWFPKDPRDDRMATLKELERQGYLGQDKVLGARVFDNDVLDYINEKRDETVQGRIMDLINKSYDSTDPVQRRILDKVAPDFSRSRLTLIDKCLEQREFLMKLMLASHFDDDMDTRMGGAGSMSAGQKFQRTIRILGGAEALLAHPLDDAITGSSGGGILSGIFDNKTRGLFSLGSFSGNDSGVSGPSGATRSRRVAIATNLLHLFPAALMGKNNVNTPGASGKTSDLTPDTLVTLCEKIVDKNITTADAYSKFMQNGGASNGGWI